MRLCSTLVVWIALLLLLLCLRSLTAASFEDDEEAAETLRKFDLNTYELLKPLFDKIRRRNVETDREKKELQQKIIELELKLSENAQDEEHAQRPQNDPNPAYLRDLRNQIIDLHENINLYKKIIDQLPSNLSVAIKGGIDQLTTFKTESLKRQISAKSDIIKEQRKQISNLTAQVELDALKLTELNEHRLEREMEVKFLMAKLKRLENGNDPQSCIPFQDTPGVHQLSVSCSSTFDVLCDSTAAGPGWTVVQQRVDGREDFFRDWATYRAGFGSLDGDFFLGLERIYRLTVAQPHELHIHIESFDGTVHAARYDHFQLAGEEDQYRLIHLGHFSGNASEDRLSLSKGQKFSTFDRDNDQWAGDSCALKNHAAWWFNHCTFSNLNGKYFEREVESEESIFWMGMTSLKRVRMLIRPREDQE